MSDFEVSAGKSRESGGWGSTYPEAKFKFQGNEISVPVAIPARSYHWQFPQVTEHNVFILKRDGSLARLPITLRTKAQMERIEEEVIYDGAGTDYIERVLRILDAERVDIRSATAQISPQREGTRQGSVALSYGYPDSFLDWLATIGLWLFLIALTWRIARNRHLPHGYALYALLFCTGTVYVLTLDRRTDDASTFRRSLAMRLARHPLLLGVLSFVMGVSVLFGGVGVLLVALAPMIQPVITANARQVQGWGHLLAFLLTALYFGGVGLLHFFVTRRRVKSLVGSLR